MSIWGINTGLGLEGRYYEVIRQLLYQLEKDGAVSHPDYGQYWSLTGDEKARRDRT